MSPSDLVPCVSIDFNEFVVLQKILCFDDGGKPRFVQYNLVREDPFCIIFFSAETRRETQRCHVQIEGRASSSQEKSPFLIELLESTVLFCCGLLSSTDQLWTLSCSTMIDTQGQPSSLKAGAPNFCFISTAGMSLWLPCIYLSLRQSRLLWILVARRGVGENWSGYARRI
jgi:hypothetical protein